MVRSLHRAWALRTERIPAIYVADFGAPSTAASCSSLTLPLILLVLTSRMSRARTIMGTASPCSSTSTENKSPDTQSTTVPVSSAPRTALTRIRSPCYRGFMTSQCPIRL